MNIDPAIISIDSELFQSVKDIEILDAIAPLNYEEQKKRFFASQFSVNPNFSYESHDFDLFRKKRDLYAIPIDKIEDSDLQLLYSEVIESYVDKLDQYKSIGTPEFLYDSLRYYGEPTDKDLSNAKFILHLPDEFEDDRGSMLSSQEIVAQLEAFAQSRGYDYEMKIVDNMIANAMVSGKTVKVNKNAVVPQLEVTALAHHELGVHLVTTLNARQQPLKILSLGCPVNTTTQEGIAILCEYLSGCLTLSRIRILALRVIAVKSMLEEKDFKRTFLLLKERYGVADNQAFTITARVYRGGGFTKDYLYLQGFHQMLNAYEQSENFAHLLSGKVSADYLDLVSRLIEKSYLKAPKYISPAIQEPAEIDDVQRFIAHAIK